MSGLPQARAPHPSRAAAGRCGQPLVAWWDALLLVLDGALGELGGHGRREPERCGRSAGRRLPRTTAATTAAVSA